MDTSSPAVSLLSIMEMETLCNMYQALHIQKVTLWTKCSLLAFMSLICVLRLRHLSNHICAFFDLNTPLEFLPASNWSLRRIISDSATDNVCALFDPQSFTDCVDVDSLFSCFDFLNP